MRKSIALLCFLALSVGFAACAGSPQFGASPKPATASLAAFKEAIRAKYDLKEKAFKEHDAESILTRFYAEDAVSVGAGFGIYKGRDQLRPLYEEAVKAYTVKVISLNTVLEGSAGWDWADFEVIPVDPKEEPFTLAILFLWVESDGTWICKGDFFVKGSLRTGKLAPPSA